MSWFSLDWAIGGHFTESWNVLAMRFHAVKCLGSVPILKSWSSFLLGAIGDLHLSARAMAQCRGAVSCSQTQAAVTSMAMTTCGDVSKHITSYFTISLLYLYGDEHPFTSNLWRSPGVLDGFGSFQAITFPASSKTPPATITERPANDWCFQTALKSEPQCFFFMTEKSQQRFWTFPYDLPTLYTHFTHVQLNLAIFPAFSQPFQSQQKPSHPAMVIPAAADSFHYVSGADGTRRPRLFVTWRSGGLTYEETSRFGKLSTGYPLVI